MLQNEDYLFHSSICCNQIIQVWIDSTLTRRLSIIKATNLQVKPKNLQSYANKSSSDFGPLEI